MQCVVLIAHFFSPFDHAFRPLVWQIWQIELLSLPMFLFSFLFLFLGHIRQSC